jgi:hypothetical protein
MAHEYLFDLSVTLASQQRHAEALKCLVAILANAPLPAMQARAGLLNARISLHSTCNLADVRALLNTLVRLPNKTVHFNTRKLPTMVRNRISESMPTALHPTSFQGFSIIFRLLRMVHVIVGCTLGST